VLPAMRMWSHAHKSNYILCDGFRTQFPIEFTSRVVALSFVDEGNLSLGDGNSGLLLRNLVLASRATIKEEDLGFFLALVLTSFAIGQRALLIPPGAGNVPVACVKPRRQ